MTQRLTSFLEQAAEYHTDLSSLESALTEGADHTIDIMSEGRPGVLEFLSGHSYPLGYLRDEVLIDPLPAIAKGGTPFVMKVVDGEHISMEDDEVNALDLNNLPEDCYTCIAAIDPWPRKPLGDAIISGEILDFSDAARQLNEACPEDDIAQMIMPVGVPIEDLCLELQSHLLDEVPVEEGKVEGTFRLMVAENHRGELTYLRIRFKDAPVKDRIEYGKSMSNPNDMSPDALLKLLMNI